MSAPLQWRDPSVLGPAFVGTVPAPIGRRMLASVLDNVVTGFLVVLVYLLADGLSIAILNEVLERGYGLFRPVVLLIYRVFGSLGEFVPVVLLLLWLFVQWGMHATRGQTLGKRLVGIRTIAVPTAGAPGWGRTSGRYLLLYGVNVVTCDLGQWLFSLSVFWDSSHLYRAWHDKAANVFLIDVRNGRDPVAGRSAAAGVAGAAVPAPVPVAPVAVVQPVPPAAPALPEPIAVPPASVVPPVPASASVPPPPVPPVPAPPAPPVPATTPFPSSAPAAAPAPAAPPAPPAAPPASPLPPPSPGGLISAVPGLSPAAPSTPPVPARQAQAPHPAGPPSPGPLPFSPFPAAPADDDLDSTVLSVAVPATTLRLVFDTGAVLAVDGRGRIGRDPAPGEEPLTHLVPLPDTTKSVSKTHLEFAVAGGALWVCDLHSTNGSSVEQGGTTAPLTPGEWAQVEVGGTVHLGRRTLRVERG